MAKFPEHAREHGLIPCLKHLGWKVYDPDPNDSTIKSYKTEKNEDKHNINQLGKLVKQLK